MLKTKENYTIHDIQALIDNEEEESLYLEYKSGEALDSPDIQKITKEVSAFANADGGYLIYGIEEDNNTHLPLKISPVKNAKRTKEWLDQKLNYIVPPIRGLRIYPIRVNNGGGMLYVVKIPRSDSRPHMATDKHYYKKTNFSSEMMAHYEIKESFFRANVSDLCIIGCDFEEILYKQTNQYLPFLKVFIVNNNNVVAQSYKLNVYFYVRSDYDVSTISSHIPANDKCIFVEKMDRNSFRTSCGCREDVYKNEVVTMGNFFLDIPDYHRIANKIYIRLVLMFNGGTSEMLYINENKSIIKDRDKIEKIMQENFSNYNSDWL